MFNEATFLKRMRFHTLACFVRMDCLPKTTNDGLYLSFFVGIFAIFAIFLFTSQPLTGGSGCGFVAWVGGVFGKKEAKTLWVPSLVKKVTAKGVRRDPFVCF